MAMRDSDPEDIRPPGPVMSTATITGVSTTPPTSTVQVRLTSSPGYRGRSGVRVMVTVGEETVCEESEDKRVTDCRVCVSFCF